MNSNISTKFQLRVSPKAFALGIILMVVGIIGTVIETKIFGNNLLPTSWKEVLLDLGLLALTMSGVIFATNPKSLKPLVFIGILYLIPVLVYLLT